MPPSYRGERNCQLTVICLAIALVLGTSVRGSVDFGAHFGGALQVLKCLMMYSLEGYAEFCLPCFYTLICVDVF